MSSDEFNDALWHKSTYSGSDNGCVEHGLLSTGRQAVRDTKDRERGVAVFGPASWQRFVDAVRSGVLGA
ncbi:DUF397 domain-containing protein [Streptomyces sp. MnatMP-M17]|uniref:DUF397 domain-containing protein n=1 Tax=unclassified Streptomyces TaxID=2593676 RepID=UPI00081D5508|nr:DUF397 domain-containing protein [Streptomyces sp. MnatMP-M17]SCG08620.1 protein of unknown function [Streptomyces sp. MnatMP-M17]